MKIIKFKGQKELEFQSLGNAAQFAIPYAKYLCSGMGYDIGCRKKEWAYPGSIPIDISFNDGYHALNLPNKNVDYIFSSHCLEHLDNWIEAMDYWYDILKSGGILFLYLPHYYKIFWRPWNDKAHKHIFTLKIIKDYMKNKGYINIFNSKKDLNYSFMIIGEKI